MVQAERPQGHTHPSSKQAAVGAPNSRSCRLHPLAPSAVPCHSFQSVPRLRVPSHQTHRAFQAPSASPEEACVRRRVGR